jgi:NTP pyrophosphatase (non-canonical NTP hydrolase)
MTLNDYQTQALKMAQFPTFRLIPYDEIESMNLRSSLVYPILGLCGECTELLEKIEIFAEEYITVDNADVHARIILELGDVLWYMAIITNALDLDLSDIASKEWVSDMSFEDYVKLINDHSNATLLGKGVDLLKGAGAFSERMKKVFRDSNGEIDGNARWDLTNILSIMLINIAQCTIDLKVTFNHVAIKNLEKLSSRKARDVIKGSGDYR